MSDTFYEMTTEELINVNPDILANGASGNPMCAVVERLPDEQLLGIAQKLHQEILEIAKTNRLTLVTLVENLASAAESAAYYEQSGDQEAKRTTANNASRNMFLRFQYLLAAAYKQSSANGCDSCRFEQSCVRSHRVLSCSGRVPVEEARS